MKSTNILALSLISLLLGVNANAAGSLLRIACDGDDIGAEVFINDKFKGECPIDIQVSEGMQKIRVVKVIDSSYEKGFNQEIRIGDGTVKKIEVTLSSPQLTTSAQKIVNERLRLESIKAKKIEEARQIALAEEERRDKELLLKQQKAAESGDVHAMVALGDRYVTGNGLDENKLSAAILFDKAMNFGDESAGNKLANLYETDSSLLWSLPEVQMRAVNIQGEDKIHHFVVMDPFFKVPGGNDKTSWNGNVSYDSNSKTMHISWSCSRDTEFFQSESESEYSGGSFTVNNLSVLGDLVSLNTKMSHGVFSQFPSRTVKMNSIENLYGQPFPLKTGARFGWKYTQNDNNDITTRTIMCGVLNDKSKSIMCDSSFYGLPSHYSWNEPSGCFMKTYNK